MDADEPTTPFDAADLADAILGPPLASAPAEAPPALAVPPPVAVSEPITAETPAVETGVGLGVLAAPTPPPVRVWSDAQRALFALVLFALVVMLIGVAARTESGEDPVPCRDGVGLFDDAEEGLFGAGGSC